MEEPISEAVFHDVAKASTLYNQGKPTVILQDFYKEPEGTEVNSTSLVPTIRSTDASNSDCLTALVDLEVQGVLVQAVVDTAAQVTVMNHNCWAAIDCQLLHSEPVSLTQADGSSALMAQRYDNVNITIGSCERKVSIHVADIADNMLLGLDILWNIGAKLDFANKVLVVNDHSSVLHIISKSNSFGAIAYVERRVVAYSGQEAILSIASPIQLSGDVLFTPMASFQHLMLPSALYSTTESTVNVPCTNLSTKCCRLNRGTAIGYFEKVSTDIDTKCSYVRAIGSKETKNTHIIDMANMAKKDLPPSGAKRLDALLEDYSDIFSKHDFDLGCFSGVEHRIHTGEATPIRQPMRRTPIKFQQEEEKHLEKMLKAGVIEPSSSEWCQPPVLVRKKDSGVRWCIDYRALNNVTMKDAFPLPLIEECFDALQGMKYMSSLDLSRWLLATFRSKRGPA